MSAEKGLTIPELAEMFGVSPSAVAHMTGRVGFPTPVSGTGGKGSPRRWDPDEVSAWRARTPAQRRAAPGSSSNPIVKTMLKEINRLRTRKQELLGRRAKIDQEIIKLDREIAHVDRARRVLVGNIGTADDDGEHDPPAEAAAGRSIGERLVAARTAQGLSMGEVARRSGVSKGFVSKIETGQAPRPGADTMERLASALGVTVPDLLGRGSLASEHAEDEGDPT